MKIFICIILLFHILLGIFLLSFVANKYIKTKHIENKKTLYYGIVSVIVSVAMFLVIDNINLYAAVTLPVSVAIAIPLTLLFLCFPFYAIYKFFTDKHSFLMGIFIMFFMASGYGIKVYVDNHQYVYISKSPRNNYYHSNIDCNYISKKYNVIKIQLFEAKENEYKQCKHCYYHPGQKYVDY